MTPRAKPDCKKKHHAIVMAVAVLSAQSALAAGEHQLFANSNFVQMQTRLNENVVSAWSASGLNVGYAYRMGFSSAIVLQYSAVSSTTEILLHGFSAGFDYAIWGGQNTFFQSGKEAFVDYEFPFRLGVFAGGTQRTYDLNSFVASNDISFDDAVPRTGSFLGVTGGVSAEIPLNENTAVVLKMSAIFPWFTEKPAQKGLVFEGGIGIGYLM